MIVKGLGANVASLQFALNRLGKESMITSDPSMIATASHVILPGVSSAQRAMAQVQAMGLKDVIRNLRQPVLGICSGMQILFKESEEGNVSGLNIFPYPVRKLKVMPERCLPHMGWNTLVPIKDDPLLAGIKKGEYVYFVHSYKADLYDFTLASTTYDETFSAVVKQENFVGMQFHPERSGKVGERFLSNFLNSV